MKIDGYDISVDALKLGESIYSGRFSLQKATYTRPDGDKIKVVIQRLDAVDAEKIHLMRSLKHENIIKFIGICHKNSDTFLVTEYAGKGDLKSYLEREGPPPPHLLKKWSKEICEAIVYLHRDKRCIHTDIRSTNFLIMDDDTLKLSSLELVKEWDHTKSTSGSNSCRWMAPEVVEKQFRSMKSDIFAIGVVLWEICTGKVPFGHIKGDYAQMDAVVKGERHPVPENCPKLKQMLDSCWERECKKRPSADVLIKDVDEGMFNPPDLLK